MEDLIFSINGKSVNPTRYEGKVRQFSIAVDEPENFGGKDSAPTPVEYILAGYAGCLNVVVNLIAKEMGITIKSLEINITGDINPEKLLGISDKERAGFKSLNIQLDINSDASSDMIQKLLTQVKERCPVNDNLANTTPVNYSI
ncbi:OsmC family protein [Sediminibacterium sp.]|uniref:OsmC family protein n=1 Tax=Sediminibacterium sp. TaxID=1917865 RepID=UPI0011D8123C|nr:OsmC family protein [Sediminibacterium sp.]KAF0240343.1 MAG: OsmC-like [Chitinophagaceae bacterium]MDO8997003.1 OsmC family protein [Sediminibacterium sp.]MDP2422150.1 OsmC family protein [Sediminibacterium sp.]TXT31112.1 MAG: OsmC-like protein [Chitinophagaceae bacterium]